MIRTIRVLIVSIFLTAFSLSLSQAQINPDSLPPRPDAFPQIFKKYTGENGYEDLVLASDLLSRSRVYENPGDSDTLLSRKRVLLQDASVSRALEMVHEALLKPVYDPRDPAKLEEATIFPEFAGFRNIARMMGMKEYVLLADGNTAGALDMMRDGIKLGYVTQGGTLISGLVGIAIQSIAINPIARHFGQLSMRNCDSVLSIVREAREREPKLAYIMNKEKEFVLRTFNSLRDKQKLSDLLSVSYEDPLHPSPEELLEAGYNQNVLESANKNPTALEALIDQVLALSKQESDKFEANLKLPINKRVKLAQIDPNSSHAAKVYSILSPSFNSALDRYDRQETQMRLLGAHASIIRYRWNHNVPPDTLSDLKTDRLFNLEILTDPYTGNLFIYKPSRFEYDLHSAGGENGEIWLPQRPRIVP